MDFLGNHLAVSILYTLVLHFFYNFANKSRPRKIKTIKRIKKITVQTILGQLLNT